MGPFIIARHHLLRIVRSPGLILILLAVPVTLAGLEYAAFGPTVASGKLPPIKVLILDNDRTFASAAVPQVFTAGGPLADMFETSPVADRTAARALFQKNEASALVIVPKGFQDALLAGGRADVQFAPNPVQTFSPAIAAAVLDMTVMIGNGIYGQAAAPLQRINAARAANRPLTADDAADIARGFFEAARRLNGLMAVSNLTVTSVRPAAETAGPGADAKQFFAFVFPGLMIFGALFVSQSLALRLLRDRARGVERRLAMTSLSPAAQIAGSFLFMVAGLIVVLVLLLAVGAIVFRIQLKNPPALLALAVGFAIFAAALHLAIIAIARNERSASFMGSGIVMLLSLLGGTFFPAEEMPAFLRNVAFVMPNGAAQQGFVDVLAHGRTLAETSGRILTTWGWALVMMAMAVAGVRRRAEHV
ncbi:MAG TPA: ABC transporter permease [Vicinamibacterales bacterium]|nr:ABC transporter permease [Vicinamibacterales bacterium]